MRDLAPSMWLRTSHHPLARLARSVRRSVRRFRARRRHGDIAAYMEAVVRDAVTGSVGTGVETGRRGTGRRGR